MRNHERTDDYGKPIRVKKQQTDPLQHNKKAPARRQLLNQDPAFDNPKADRDPRDDGRDLA